MKGNKLKLFGIIAAVAVIGLTAVGCDNGSSPGSGGGSSQVTVTFYRNFRAWEGSGQSPQPITVTAGTVIELPGRGNMQRGNTMFAGWSTQANGGVNHEAGDNFRVQGNVILYARWIQLEPIPITISSEFPQHTQVSVTLTHSTWGQIGNTVTMWVGSDGDLAFSMNAFPGTYNIRLEFFAFGEGRRFNSDGPLAITRPDPATGEHTNEFSIEDDFVEVLPVHITIQGLPGDNWNPARIELRQDGNTVVDDVLGWSNGTTSVTFNQVFSAVAADNYEILFRWSNDNNSVFRMASVELDTGQNVIEFDDFDEIQSVEVTITVTGVPSSFVGYRGTMTLIHNDSKFQLPNVPTATVMLESTTTFTFVFRVFPGTHYIRLTVSDEDLWGDVHEIRERTVNIAATGTTNVTWTSFGTVPFTRITINGIDTRFNGYHAGVFLGNLEAMNTNNMQNVTAVGWATVSNRSLTAVLGWSGWVSLPITDEDVYGNVIVYFFDDDDEPVGEYATNAIVEFPAGRNTTVQWGAFNIDLSGRPIQLHQALLGQIRERARSMQER